MKHLLRIADLDRTELELLLDMAAHAKAEPHRFRHVLAGDSVVLHFAKPSTRTRISFETAVARLEEAGIEVVRIAGSELGSGRGGPRCMSCPISRDSLQR